VNFAGQCLALERMRRPLSCQRVPERRAISINDPPHPYPEQKPELDLEKRNIHADDERHHDKDKPPKWVLRNIERAHPPLYTRETALDLPCHPRRNDLLTI